MEKAKSNGKVATKLAGKAVLITRYIADGPGYAGPLLCQIGNGVIEVVMPIIQDMDGNLSLYQLKIDETVPFVAAVLDYEDKHAQLIFDHLNENSRHYCESVDQVDTDRLAIVRWSNGALGALLFWGENSYVSAFHFEGAFVGETMFNLEDVQEGAFVTRQAALESVCLAPGQDQNAAPYIYREPRWLVHPEYGFTAVDDPRIAVKAPENEG